MHQGMHVVSQGYRLDLPRAGRFSPEQARALGVPVKQWKTLQHGESITLDGGRVIQPEAVLGPARQGLSFVFSGDTAPCPALEKAGFLFTDRETVEKAEKMKVCTCLNPLHTALAVFGCLLGYKKISEEMKDRDLVSLLRRIGYEEGLPAVTDPGILDPREFLDTVLTVRFPNPFLPDSPQRIATDTSQKLSVRFGETIKTYMESPDLDMDRLRGIPLVLAGWLRYRMAVDDDGRPMELSPDPMAERLGRQLERIQLGGCLQMEHIRESEHVLRPEGVPGSEIREALPIPMLLA